MMNKRLLSIVLLALLVAGCTGPQPGSLVDIPPTPIPTLDSPTAGNPMDMPMNMQADPSAVVPGQPDVTFTLKTGMGGGRMYYTGVGGEIDGIENPELKVSQGAVVEIALINGDGVMHDLTVDKYGRQTPALQEKNSKASVIFKVDQAGVFAYYCSMPGHRQGGMEGKLVVGDAPASPVAAAPSVVKDPADLPAPIGSRGPQKVRVDLEVVELEGQLADGVTFTYWTFNGTVPGPFIRIREGDQVEVHLKNPASSSMAHSVDFHAVTGPGGGAVYTTTQPGQETSFTFTALNPGLFVYHCATPSVAHHISAGMYGMILVEPEGGLPAVDHEYYVMQGEIYTSGAYGEKGHQDFSDVKMLSENPEYYIFNGAVGALTMQHPLQAKTGETVRIFFGVGGPNKTSSFHVIGEVFDRVYNLASLTSEPLTNVQTVMVPTGGAAMVEFKLQVPGRYMLVDHSLSRMERGLMGYLIVDGPPAPDIISGTPMPGSGH